MHPQNMLLVLVLTLLLLLLLLLLLPLPLSLSLSSYPKSMSAYDALRSHGLPIGLFPNSIQDFSLDPDTGHFHATISTPCTAKFETDVHYDRNISGTVSFAHLTALSGISAQELFLWFPVKEIRVDVPSSGLIYFDVGVIYKQFSLSHFETPPDCVPANKKTKKKLSSPTLCASERGAHCPYCLLCTRADLGGCGTSWLRRMVRSRGAFTDLIGRLLIN